MLRPTRIRHLLAVAAAVSLAAPATASGARADVVERVAHASARQKVVAFDLSGVNAGAVVRATVTSGRARKRVPLRAVRRGARGGVLRVRKPRGRKRARLTLRLDRRAPNTRIVERLRSETGRRVQLRFAATEKASTFQCRLDGGRWAACSSPRTFSRLADGEHTVHVRAKDRAGNVDPTPAASTWTAGSGTTTATTPKAPVTPVVPVAGGPRGGGTTQAPGFSPLADADAAARVARSAWEPRPANGTANAKVPTAAELSAYRGARGANQRMCASGLDLKVTGGFAGTTDEIIQWASYKWGLDTDLLRAMSTVESWWRQDAVGDAGESFGIIQVKRTVHGGTFPLSRDSTAFALDYLGAILRHYVDGCAAWLNDVDRGQPYVPGDVWGSVGAWYAGRWHTAAAEGYITKVRTALNQRTWAGAGF